QQDIWDKAREILVKIGGEESAQEELSNIKTSLNIQKASFSDLLKPGLRLALAIGIILSVFSQITGINVIMYYAPEIFKSAGDSTDSALLQTILVGAINVLMTLVAIKYVDRLGRRRLLLIGSAGMAVC